MADRTVRVRLTADTSNYSREVNAAAASTDRLKGKAEQIDGRRFTASFDVRTGKAHAEITALQTKLAKLEGTRTTNVRLNTREASRDAALLGNVIATLGPAAVTAGAVAGAALLGLGTTVGSVAAAAGVTALAFAGVGDALEAMNDYAIDPTEANLEDLNDKLGAISETGREFTSFLHGLRPEIEQLQRVAQEGMLPGVQRGLESLISLMPNVERLIGNTATALGDLAAATGAALDSPFWREYIDFLAREAGPTVEGFGRILGNLVQGFAGMQIAFNPLAQDMISGLAGMAEAFARWGSTLESNQGFQRFVSYVREMGPQVLDALGAVAGALGALAQAAAPLGGPVLKIIEALADGIAALASSPVGTPLIAVAAALGAVNLGLRAYDVAKHSRVASLLGGTGAAASGAAGALGRLGGALPLIALGIVGVGIAYDGLRSKATDAAAAVLAGSMSIGEAIAQETQQILNKSNALDGLNSSLVPTLSLEKAREIAIGRVTAQIEAQIRTLPPMEQATARVTLAQAGLTAAVDQFGARSPQARAAADALTGATRRLELQEIAVRFAVDLATAAMIYQSDQALALASSENDAERAAIGFERAQINAATATRDHGAASIEARTANLDLEDSAYAAAVAAGEKAFQEAEAEGATDSHERKTRATIQSLADFASQIKGPVRGELMRLAADLLGIPDAHFKVTGEGQIVGLRSVSFAASGGRTPYGYASGGEIRGPGTGTSDDIVARVSNGEWVVREKVSRDQGYAAMDALNRGQADIVPRARAEHLALKGSILRSNPHRREHPPGGYAGGGQIGMDGLPRFAFGGYVGTGVQPPSEVARRQYLQVRDRLIAEMRPRIQRQVREAEGLLMGGGSGPGGWRWQMNVLRAGLGNVPLISGYRPGAITATGNRSYHGMGRAVDIPPRIQYFNWIRSNYGRNTKELIYSPANNRQIHNGRNHYYTGVTRGDHWDHVHWAYDRGGLLSGRGDFRKDTLQPERVLSPRQTVSFERLVSVLDEQRPRNVRVPVMAGAAAAGESRGDVIINVGGIHNPVAERGSDSVQRTLSRMSELGMFE